MSSQARSSQYSSPNVNSGGAASYGWTAAEQNKTRPAESPVLSAPLSQEDVFESNSERKQYGSYVEAPMVQVNLTKYMNEFSESKDQEAASKSRGKCTLGDVWRVRYARTATSRGRGLSQAQRQGESAAPRGASQRGEQSDAPYPWTEQELDALLAGCIGTLSKDK